MDAVISVSFPMIELNFVSDCMQTCTWLQDTRNRSGCMCSTVTQLAAFNGTYMRHTACCEHALARQVSSARERVCIGSAAEAKVRVGRRVLQDDGDGDGNGMIV